MDDDRRLLGRITPRATLEGRIGHTPVRIVDLSLRGSRVAHHAPLPIGLGCQLIFHWQERAIEAFCEIVRSRLAFARPGHQEFHTGLRIVEAANGSAPLLRQFIYWHVQKALEAQIADARGLPPPADLVPEPVEDLYVRCELIRGGWRKVITATPEQPTVGFTLRAREAPHEIEKLCNTYLLCDRDARQLIQRMAAASLESRAEIPALQP